MSTQSDDGGRFRTIADRLHSWRGEDAAAAGEHGERNDSHRGGPLVSETLRHLPQAHPRSPQEFAPKGKGGRARPTLIEGRDPRDLDDYAKSTAGRRRPAGDIAADLDRELRSAAAGAENRRADLAGLADDGSAVAAGDRAAGAESVAPGQDAAAPDGGASYLPTLESHMAEPDTADDILVGLGELGPQVLATFHKVIIKARTTAANERAAIEAQLVEERARTADLAAEVSDLKSKLAEFEAWKAAMPGQVI